MANEYLKSSRLPNEKNDCCVIALSYAFDLDYTLAHKICKDNGRKDSNGFLLEKVFKLKHNDFRKFDFKGDGGKVVTYYPRPKLSVGRFRNRNLTGTYIVNVGGHVFTMKDGIIYNNSNDRAIVDSYFRVTHQIYNESLIAIIKIKQPNKELITHLKLNDEVEFMHHKSNENKNKVKGLLVSIFINKENKEYCKVKVDDKFYLKRLNSVTKIK